MIVDNQQFRMNTFWSARQLLSNSGRESLLVEDLQWLENRGAQLVRFDADSLRPPSNLIPEAEQIRFLNGRGVGLAAIYDGIRDRHEDAFKRISADVTRLFPAVKRLTLRAISNAQKVLEIELQDGSRIASAEMSEGLLYYLAFAALAVIKPAAVVAVEEPETGLHPARIKEVVDSLRSLSRNGVQVVVATHSPLVVNELDPSEVTVVTRDPDAGTRIRNIGDTPEFESRSKIYNLGELWLSYANGVDEGPLLQPTQ